MLSSDIGAKVQELKARLTEINDLNMAQAVLVWDRLTYMPPGGITIRARQLSTLARLSHERLTHPALGKLLDWLAPYADSLPYEADDAALIRVARRDYERAVNVPATFVAQLADHQATAHQAWAKARAANDFAVVRPFLEKTVELSRRYAEFFPGYEHIADPLIDRSDYGMRTADIRTLFAQLRARLVPLMQAIIAQPVVDDACLHQHFPEAEQLAFGLAVCRQLGFDFEHGRQDKSLHPFMTAFAPDDVRMTTRVKENDLCEALFGTIHETGHALYEQAIHPDLAGTLLGQGTSAGVHESQSRLWENVIGRSRPFWTFFYPRLQEQFPRQLGHVTLDTFYQAINKVQPSLIRGTADEVTYNLHVIIRFDLELALLEGEVAVRDLPEAWCSRYQTDLGLDVTDDHDGLLQDDHWYDDLVGGAFQGYTLGNILSIQFYDAALKARPEIPADCANGRFETLRAWLAENVYQYGRKYTAIELVEQATGGPISIEPYSRYLQTKYGQLYNL